MDALKWLKVSDSRDTETLQKISISNKWGYFEQNISQFPQQH